MSETQNWQVTRLCCTSGYCHECHQRGRMGRPARIVHADGLTEFLADKMVTNWRDYDPQKSRMPEDAPECLTRTR